MMRAGYGCQEITPPLGVELAGYGYYLERRAKRVRDPLFARALMLENRDCRALVVSCDLLGLRRDVCDEVLCHAREIGLSPDHVTIVSTHTHTGPAIKYHEGCGAVDENYVSHLAEKICRAVDAACHDQADVTALSRGFQPFESDLIYNRAAADGPIDRVIRGFSIERKGKPTIAVVSAACHGVFRGRIAEISADFAGEVNAIMEKEGFCPLYLNGLCGDIDPKRTGDERLTAFAQLVTSAFTLPKTPLPMTLKAGSLPFTLRLTSVTIEEIQRAASRAVEAAGGESHPAGRVARAWEREMLEKFASLRSEETVYCRYLILGGVPVIAIPFEGFTRIGQEIRSCLNRPDALILGCAEELLGYLPTRDDIQRGAYAALESTFLYRRLPVVPGEAERLGQDVGSALERILYESDRSVHDT